MNLNIPTDPATVGAAFAALYGLARLVSHLTPSYTVVGKLCAWILGNVPGAGAAAASSSSAASSKTSGNGQPPAP